MEEMPKIQISVAADQELEAMLKETNEGFASGRVKKPQLISWIISHFREKYFSQQLKQIRADHFDDIAHLEAVVKQLKEARQANVPIAMQELLTPVLHRSRSNATLPGARPNTRGENKPGKGE
jgi:hypothetical protein